MDVPEDNGGHHMTPTSAQLATEKKLVRKGFEFSNWIPASPDCMNRPTEGTENLGNMVMVKRVKTSRQYCEIAPDGTIEGA